MNKKLIPGILAITCLLLPQATNATEPAGGGEKMDAPPVAVVAKEPPEVFSAERARRLPEDQFAIPGSFVTRGNHSLLSSREIPLPNTAQERHILKEKQAVELTFPGVEPKAIYRLELTFLSNHDLRAVRVVANGVELEAALALPKNKVLQRQWSLPPEAVAAGQLVVRVEKVRGPDAVVSRVRLLALSPGAKPLAALPVIVSTPRLSPRPQSVGGVKNPQLDLSGTWRFLPNAPKDFATAPATETGWENINVPGEWVMQGFTPPGWAVKGYRRAVTIPADWSGRRVKLRCDGVFSDATVWVNGHPVGSHRGGFTPFEFDVTDMITPGQPATLTLAVKSQETADQLASATCYASHDLGGIPRRIQLWALPTVNLAALRTHTTFDSSYENAVLEVTVKLANDGVSASEPVHLKLNLQDPQGKTVVLDGGGIDVPEIPADQTVLRTVRLPISRPQLWDVEHPRLYTLNAALDLKGGTAETVATRVGFRQVELRNRQLLVNGHPVKLRGVCRHEVDPIRGRSLTGDQWRKDAELFLHGNVNFVRTSHYPPDEEFLNACDELGLLVECEAPFCWAWWEPKELVLSQSAEMVEFNRNHPSIVIWSVANETDWADCFRLSSSLIQGMDDSRPRIFATVTFNENGLPDNPQTLPWNDIEIASMHYPSPKLVERSETYPKPVLYDEYCHVNAYNREEQLVDPGVRDVWGLSFAKTWESMRQSSGCLGGALWAAIDDTFFMPSGRTVGYGSWGPLDGWRRPKPEYWHMAKVYSPVRVAQTQLDVPSAGQPLRLTIENRSDFADLSEMRFDWMIAGQSGTARTAAPPNQSGVLEIPLSQPPSAGQELELRVIGPRGFMVDAYRFTLGGEPTVPPPSPRPPGCLKLQQSAQTVTVQGDGFTYRFDAATGQLVSASIGGHELPLTGPCLTLVPMVPFSAGDLHLTDKPVIPQWGLCTQWKCASVKATQDATGVTVSANGAYAEATGGYDCAIDLTGRLTVRWNFNLARALKPRQTGVTFDLPAACDTLSWRRRGQWSWYPEDHIGRSVGQAKADSLRPRSGLLGPSTRPDWPWSQDQNDYGSNDFRSTKYAIYEATLADETFGLRAIAAADRHVRAWRDAGRSHLLVMDYTNDGSEMFLQPIRAIPDRPVASGGGITGSVQVEAVPLVAHHPYFSIWSAAGKLQTPPEVGKDYVPDKGDFNGADHLGR